ncbi:hypothetical protein J6590_096121 [Homalodisca vitripennis]|nr:hypothetical protein J6590_096121 [Homalodisca vitripennis]
MTLPCESFIIQRLMADIHMWCTRTEEIIDIQFSISAPGTSSLLHGKVRSIDRWKRAYITAMTLPCESFIIKRLMADIHMWCTRTEEIIDIQFSISAPGTSSLLHGKVRSIDRWKRAYITAMTLPYPSYQASNSIFSYEPY